MNQKTAKRLAKIAGVPKQTAQEVWNFVCRPVLDKNGNVRMVRVRSRSHREKGKMNVEREILRLDAVTKELVTAKKRELAEAKAARKRSRAEAAKRVQALAKRKTA